MANRKDTSAAKDVAADFARTVAMTQGSIFLRELLRQTRREHASVRIGVTKDDIEANLIDAIQSGALTLDALRTWLDDVEGWGKQHVYLFKVDPPRNDAKWAETSRVRTRAIKAGFGAAWGAEPSPTFPDELVLSSVAASNGRFTVRWQQRHDSWRRDAAKDHPSEIIDGDLYEFRAFRQELSRSTMRLVVLPGTRRAALFIQLPIERHEEVRKAALATAATLFPVATFTLAKIAAAVKALDQQELDSNPSEHGRVRSQNTRFSAGGATVAFAANREDEAWKNIGAVRRVRNALDGRDFQGESGKFLVSLRAGPGMHREVVMSLSARDRRIYLWSQMSADEVWLVLDHVIANIA